MGLEITHDNKGGKGYVSFVTTLSDSLDDSHCFESSPPWTEFGCTRSGSFGNSDGCTLKKRS